jgi:hypothetical protein
MGKTGRPQPMTAASWFTCTILASGKPLHERPVLIVVGRGTFDVGGNKLGLSAIVDCTRRVGGFRGIDYFPENVEFFDLASGVA